MPESEAAKRVPHSLEAERAVLGACLFDRSKLDNVREKLAADDFYAPAHRLIYECICRLADGDSPCDLVTLGDELRNAGDLERAGGLFIHRNAGLTMTTAIFVDMSQSLIQRSHRLHSQFVVHELGSKTFRCGVL